MIEKTARVYIPQTLHRDSLSDSRLSITDADGKLLVSFCPRNSCAGVWYPDLQKWVLYSPVTAAELVAALPKLGVSLADGPGLQAWLDAISQDFGAQRSPSPLN